MASVQHPFLPMFEWQVASGWTHSEVHFSLSPEWRRTRKGCSKTPEVVNVLHLSSCGLQAPLPRPVGPLPLPSAAGGGGGATRGMQAGGLAPGAHSKGDPRPKGHVCATQHAAEATPSTTLQLLLRADGLAGNPEGWKCASQSPGPETARRKGLPAGG